MPVKTNHRRPHHTSHHKEKRTKRFLKVYAPYIPLLAIVLTGLFVSSRSEIRNFNDSTVKSYAINTTDTGLLEATNKMRAREGLKPLVLNSQLDLAAQSKAQDMSNRNYWSHVTPDGKQPWEFIDKEGYVYRKAAENLAYGFDTSNSTVNGWMNSPGHRANIMDPALEEVGFGIINNSDYQSHGPETIVVAMYGQPSIPLIASPSSPVKSDKKVAAASQPRDVSYIESLAGAKAPWVTFGIGLVMGLIMMYLVVKHARRLRKAAHGSERFIIRHPLLDITLIALIALAAVVSQSVGKIQ